MPGIGTLAAEVTKISPHGLWLLVDEEELLLPFADFPWFRSATVAQLSEVERPSEDHLYWPALDVDLSVASIRAPASFPRVAGLNRVTWPRLSRWEHGSPPTSGRAARTLPMVAADFHQKPGPTASPSAGAPRSRA